MTAISNTFRPSTARAHRRSARSAWRGVGLGVALVTIVASMTALGSHEKSRADAAGLWMGVSEPPLSRGWDESVPPVLFPLGALSEDAER
jgi:hypothetical protein